MPSLTELRGLSSLKFSALLSCIASAKFADDLTSDVLYNIFPYLHAADFLSLTGSTKSLLSYSQDPTYWRTLTRTTFRIPPQPLLQADGARWRWLYKNLSTKTRLFTWGSNGKGNLGHAGSGRFASKTPWPGTVSFPDDIGVIADVQCGGWATYMLNSSGVIYMFGAFDGSLSPFCSITAMIMLQFPEQYRQTTASRYDPCTAIRQFSAGRYHLLGLTDDGSVWSWISEVGFRISSPDGEGMFNRQATRVTAGWDRSSAYINGIGIVYWDPLRWTRVNKIKNNTVNMFIIPGTGYRRKPDDRDLGTLESRVGEVTNHIVLEGYIVFITDEDKIFCYQTSNTISIQSEIVPAGTTEPTELSTFYPDNPQSPLRIRDLQGSYRSFAVFTDSGSVLTASCTLLNSYFDSRTEHSRPLPSPEVIPGLQDKSVISIAFGDHHFLALHSYGVISSYGIECQTCGSLGLGGPGISSLRGLRHAQGRFSGDSRLKEGEGRSVWFEPMMSTWLQLMREKMNDDEASERAKMIRDGHDGACAAVSDYFEREGRKWEDGITSEGELGAYFVLKASAAGWSSAALVLVDEEKAEKARGKYKVVSNSNDCLPVDQIKGGTATNIARERAVDLLVRVGRWFLGLSARDAAAARRIAQSSANSSFQQAGDGERDPDGRTSYEYVWSNHPFPRLRMADGKVMPGEISVTD